MMDWIYSLWDNRTFGAARSSKWSQVRKQHLALYPKCAVCNKKGTLLSPNQAHHILPVSFDVDRKYELDYHNLITLCREDHLTFGHLKNFSSRNPDIVNDAKIWRAKILNRPKKMQD